MPMVAVERMRIESEPKSDSDAVNSFVHNEMLRKSESDPIFESINQVVKFRWLYPAGVLQISYHQQSSAA